MCACYCFCLHLCSPFPVNRSRGCSLVTPYIGWYVALDALSLMHLILIYTFWIAHRFLVGYVYARTHSQTGGLLHMWLLRRFGTLLSLQPILLGLICLALHFWEEAGVLIGTGFFVIAFVEIYTSWKTRLPGRNSLSPIIQNSLDTFASGADTYLNEADSVNGSNPTGTRARGSMASVLEMMSVTLAVMPSSSNHKGAVPLRKIIFR
jgi:hypothetical protein